MTPDRNTFSDVWDQLDAKYAERVRVTDAATVGDEEIVRRWKDIGEGYLSRCITALSLFTDAKNTKPQLWVKDPVCGREVFPGIYRIVTVDVDIQKAGLKGIIQTLRKGWAQDADWLEARLVESERGPANDVSQSGVVDASDNPTKLLKIKFPNCDPGKAESIASSLGSVSTYSNVVVRGETYSGTWNTVWAASRLEEDGSGTVTLFLALAQYNLKSYDNWGTEREQDIFYVYDCPKAEAQGIIESWKSAYPVGSSATTNYSRSNGLVDLVLRRRTETTLEADFGTTGLDCRYTETQTAIFGTDDDEAYPIPAVSNDAGVSYNRSVRSNGDGTFDVILTKREAKYRNITGIVIERSGDSVSTQQQQLGLTTQTPASMDEEAGKIKVQRVEVRDDCSRDVTTVVQDGTPQESTETTVTRAYTETKVEKTVQLGEIAPPSQEAGKIKRVRNSESKYPQRFDTMESVREINAIPEVVEYDTADDALAHSSATEDIGIANNGGLVVELEAGAGESVQAAVRYDKESDTLDVTKVVTAANEQEARRTEQRGDASVEVVEKTATAVPEDDAVETPGVIIRVENKESRFKDRYDTSVATETGKAQETTRKTVAAGYEETVAEKTYQDAPLADPTQADGHIRRNESRESKYPGKYETSESDREVKQMTATAKGGTPLYDEQIVTVENDSADRSSESAGSLGVTIRNESRKNEAGRFDNRKVTRTSKSFGPKEGTFGTPLAEETISLYENQDDLPDDGAASDGYINDLSGRINDDGKVSFVKRLRAAIIRVFSATKSGETEFTQETTESQLNQASLSLSRGSNESLSASIRVNEFGLLDATVRRETPKPEVSDTFTSEADGYKQVSRTKYVNATTIPTASGKGQRVDAERTQFGTYNAVKTVVSATEFYVDLNTPSGHSSSLQYTRMYFGIEDPTAVQARISTWFATISTTGQQYRYSSSLSRDGDGFYNLTLNAVPKESGGGATDWEDGFDFTLKNMKSAGNYATTSAVVTFTSSKIKVQDLLDDAASAGNVCYNGAGGGTSVQFIGRGRYKVTITKGTP